ncbi:MAG: hypothetical protein ACXW4Z_21830 [Candidatus Binatia bacterium]
MPSQTQRRVVSALRRISFLCVTLLVCPSPLLSSVGFPNQIVCLEDFSQTRRTELASKLRAITGWQEIGFDQSGALQVGSREARGGSQTARNLVSEALSGTNVIILEDASNRKDVVFCRVVSGRWKHHSSEMPPTFIVLIDFADFDHLMGDEPALRAFDAGWAVLHEIDHVVNDSADSSRANDAGECENHINAMRRECDVPLRSEYFFTYFPYAQQSEFRTRLVRLAFDHEDPVSRKRRRYWVMWDATLVGGLNVQQITRGR